MNFIEACKAKENGEKPYIKDTKGDKIYLPFQYIEQEEVKTFTRAIETKHILSEEWKTEPRQIIKTVSHLEALKAILEGKRLQTITWDEENYITVSKEKSLSGENYWYIFNQDEDETDMSLLEFLEDEWRIVE